MTRAPFPRQWRVTCNGRDLGHVIESTEARARCAALAKFGADAEECEALPPEQRACCIGPDDAFEVTPT